MGAKGARELVSKESEKTLRRSKRIILVFTKEFIETNFANISFIEILRDLYRNDSNCVLIAINKGYDFKVMDMELSEKILSPVLVDDGSINDAIVKKRRGSTGGGGARSGRGCCGWFADQIKYQCGLSDIETIDYNDSAFYKKFHYAMPILPYDDTKASVITYSKTRLSSNGGGGGGNNDSFDYASDYKHGSNMKQIIVPIPEFMRTKLGFAKKAHGQHLNCSGANCPNCPIPLALTLNTNDHHSIHISTLKSPKYPNMDYQSHHGGMPTPQQTLNMTGGGRRLSTVSSAVTINEQLNGLRVSQNMQEAASASVKSRSSNVRKQHRSETPDILAMFAPNPSTVVHVDKQRGSVKSKHRSSSTDYPGTTTGAANNDDFDI
jgi:hypothetical protein